MDVIYPRITDGTDTIFSFLLLAGYLKPVSDAVETEFGTFMELALPNKEIRRVYNTEILSWLRGTVDGNVMAGLEKALYLNDGKKLQEFLRKYMITCISCSRRAHKVRGTLALRRPEWNGDILPWHDAWTGSRYVLKILHQIKQGIRRGKIRSCVGA